MYCKLIQKGLQDSIEKRFFNILNCNTIEANMQLLLLFLTLSSKISGIHTSSSRDKLSSIFKRAVTAESITTSEENVEIEDHSDFHDWSSNTK